jgi:hypothetical protein
MGEAGEACPVHNPAFQGFKMGVYLPMIMCFITCKHCGDFQ